MKHLALILIAFLLTFTVRAQEVEMFSLEKELDFPGFSKKDIQERSYAWLRTLVIAPVSESDILTFIGYRADWVHRYCTLQYNGKDFRTEYSFSVSVITREDGRCTFRLYNPLVSSYRGRITILSEDGLPVTYDGYLKGMFGAVRNQDARIAICNEVKLLLTEEFKSMANDLVQAVKDPVTGFEFAQE